MLKNILVFIIGMGLSTAAFATLEVQISSNSLSFGSAGYGASGTGGGIHLVDNGNDSETIWSFSGEIYTTFTEQIQLGGLLSVSDFGDNSDTAIKLGALGRYNLSTELRDSMFFSGGIIYSDFGDQNSTALNMGFGKRFAASETLTWTPNVQLNIPVAGDIDDGYMISFNILSFSGFMM